MNFDFDAIVERAGTDSVKWARYADSSYPGGVIPLWVADMDFAAPPPVLAALRQRIEHGVFGYNQPTASQVDAVIGYLARKFDWNVEPEWIVWLPGLVSGLNVACRAVGEAGDAVFTATPIYPPFLSAPASSARRVASAPLVCDSAGWLWDFPTVDAVLRTSRAKLFLLCHPHNPTGRVWNEDELWQIALLAEKHDMVVCSDEIHNGLILSLPCRRPAGSPLGGHRLLATLSPEIAARTITLMAPSKTFNIPGLGCAFAIIPDGRLRRSFRDAMHGIVPHVNALGMVATEAALTVCDDWQAALLDYLRGNLRAVERAVAAAPGLDMRPVEATYLAWIDARQFAAEHGIDNPSRYFEQHGLGLSDGADFGAPGFVRLNFGTRRALLEEALARLRQATGS
ncbi:MAG: PatB family C-S lyase [Sulfuritalea sp.]|jgi:cystathionine beta-lyase|nr:PatB family C-S lyase [Sulfuritalea sp.]